MSAKILDGQHVSNLIKQELKEKISLNRLTPKLVVILVGNDPASEVYVGHKRKACAIVGITSVLHKLPPETTQTELLALIENCNNDDAINGILLQLPLPPQCNSDALLEKINPKKDIDGFHPYNLGRLAQRRPCLRPCTPYGIIQLLQHYDIKLSGLNVVIVGASNIVGRPLALEFLLAKSTVTIAHRFTNNLEQLIRNADCVVSATGQLGVINSAWIKEGAIVIDVGIHRLQDGSLRGDIDFAKASEKAAWITPVPGGVGPMTVATLLQNTVQACLS
jgi:methylenetetrahydrofolate dehydrogenase (NADP+)/methenyltetrahydrofolate cyclohydrolase